VIVGRVSNAKEFYVKRRTRSALRISSQHAVQALQALVDEGKLSARDVVQALRRRERTIEDLRRRLAELVEGVSGVASRKARAVRRGAPQKARKKSSPISKAQRAAWQAQGRYMAAVRQLSAEAKAKVKAIREESGVRAAIATARKMAKSA
jgi:hypothetical protein